MLSFTKTLNNNLSYTPLRLIRQNLYNYNNNSKYQRQAKYCMTKPTPTTDRALLDEINDVSLKH